VERIGFAKRFYAFLIDLVIVMVAGGVLSALFGGSVGGAMSGTGAGGESALVAGALAGTVVFILVGLGYGLIEAFAARSPGGMVMKIIIRNQDGSPADQGTLFLRWAIKNSGTLASLVVLLPFLGWLSFLSTVLHIVIFVGSLLCLRDDKLTLQDILAKTAVYPAG